MASFSFSGAGSTSTDDSFSFACPTTTSTGNAMEAEHIGKFKCILVGDGGVGKTAYVKKLQTNEFEKRYVATLGVSVRTLDFQTDCGKIEFNMWDCAGQEKFGGLRDGYWIKAQCGIIMFDVTARITYKHTPNWFRDITRVCGEWASLESGPRHLVRTNLTRNDSNGNTLWLYTIPLVLVGNKVDVRDRKVSAKSINFHRKINLPYYDISTKSNYNLEKPVLCLSRKIATDGTGRQGETLRPEGALLKFVESPQDITQRLMQSCEWQEALQTLPEEANELSCFLLQPTKYGSFLMNTFCKMECTSASLRVLTHVLDRCPDLNFGSDCIQNIKRYLQQDGVTLATLVALLTRRGEAAAVFYDKIAKSIESKQQLVINKKSSFLREESKDFLVLGKALRFIDHHAFVEFCCVSSLYSTPDLLQIVRDYLMPTKSFVAKTKEEEECFCNLEKSVPRLFVDLFDDL